LRPRGVIGSAIALNLLFRSRHLGRLHHALDVLAVMYLQNKDSLHRSAGRHAHLTISGCSSPNHFFHPSMAAVLAAFCRRHKFSKTQDALHRLGILGATVMRITSICILIRADRKYDRRAKANAKPSSSHAGIQPSH